MIDWGRITHLTFDCYGTLIDWESGILSALAPALAAHGVTGADEAELLRSYARHEAAAEAGPYLPYRDVLRSCLDGLGRNFAFTPTAAERDAFADSAGDWPPFADTVDALRRLHTRFKLVIVSNIDDDLFARTARLLEVPFDEVVTAQQVGSYKPARGHFDAALARTGAPVGSVLHVAQSLYHDHVPAKALGFTTCWANRASRLPGVGVAPPPPTPARISRSQTWRPSPPVLGCNALSPCPSPPLSLRDGRGVPAEEASRAPRHDLTSSLTPSSSPLPSRSDSGERGRGRGLSL
jgi:2-haloacid dehalogenase